MALLEYLLGLTSRHSSWGTDLWDSTYMHQRPTGKPSSGKLPWKFYLGLAGKQPGPLNKEHNSNNLFFCVQEIGLHLQSLEREKIAHKNIPDSWNQAMATEPTRTFKPSVHPFPGEGGISYTAAVACSNSSALSSSS